MSASGPSGPLVVILNRNLVILYIFGKLGASSKQWFILYFISSKLENVLGI